MTPFPYPLTEAADAEFRTASPVFVERITALPWDRPLAGSWRALDEGRSAITQRGQIGVWSGMRLAPTPVWRVGDSVVRLSLLQLIWRLPRCEVYTGPVDAMEPLFFRFSGGRGMIAADPRLTLWSYHLFAPLHDCLSGERVERGDTPKRRWGLPGWPPADATEA
jgi:hypothetical protein